MESILRKINEASLKFLFPLETHEVYKTIIEEALKLVKGEYGTIFLFQGDGLKNVFSSQGFENLEVRKRGYTYDAFKKNKPLLLQDDDVLNIHPIVKKMGVRSILFIPLSYEDQSIGVLTIRSTKNKKFSHKELDVLKLFGSMASLAIQKSNLFSEKKKNEIMKEQSKQIENIFKKINNAGLKFLTPLSYSDALHTVVKESVNLLSADWAGLYLAKAGELYEAATFPFGRRLFVPRRRGYTYQAYKEKRTFFFHSNKLEEEHPELKGGDFRSTFVIPLSYQGKSLGALTIVSHKDQRFTNNQLQLFKIFGSYATLAIRKAIVLDEIKEALQIRNLFISMAAHELRTPITTINGYIQLLKSKIEYTTYPQSKKWIDQLHWESNRLIKLVNELLEVNRIKAGLFEYSLQECDIRIIIQRALSTLKFTQPNRKIEFVDKSPKINDIIIADFDKILQVLINIIENAAKFSPPETKIIVTLESKAKSIKISVQDYGKGIKHEDLEHLFEEFYKGRNPGVEEGMGLGLFITKNIVKQHHGSITVHSKENKGTRVDIKLPKMQLDQIRPTITL